MQEIGDKDPKNTQAQTLSQMRYFCGGVGFKGSQMTSHIPVREEQRQGRERPGYRALTFRPSSVWPFGSNLQAHSGLSPFAPLLHANDSNRD